MWHCVRVVFKLWSTKKKIMGVCCTQCICSKSISILKIVKLFLLLRLLMATVFVSIANVTVAAFVAVGIRQIILASVYFWILKSPCLLCLTILRLSAFYNHFNYTCTYAEILSGLEVPFQFDSWSLIIHILKCFGFAFVNIWPSLSLSTQTETRFPDQLKRKFWKMSYDIYIINGCMLLTKQKYVNNTNNDDDADAVAFHWDVCVCIFYCVLLLFRFISFCYLIRGPCRLACWLA